MSQQHRHFFSLLHDSDAKGIYQSFLSVTSSAMRASLLASRRFSARALRPRTPQFWACGGRWNSSSAETENKHNSSDSESSAGASSPFWTPGKALLFSAFAAGLGYSYASLQIPAKQTKPQYGSAQDFEKVRNGHSFI